MGTRLLILGFFVPVYLRLILFEFLLLFSHGRLGRLAFFARGGGAGFPCVRQRLFRPEAIERAVVMVVPTSAKGADAVPLVAVTG